jgi:hypothetical protein
VFHLTKAGVGKKAVVLGHSICDGRKPCLAIVACECCCPLLMTISLPMMQVMKKDADAVSIWG